MLSLAFPTYVGGVSDFRIRGAVRRVPWHCGSHVWSATPHSIHLMKEARSGRSELNNPRRAQGDTSTSISRKRPRATIPDAALESEDEMISPMNGVPRRAISRGTPSRVVQETVTVLGKPRGHQKADISFGKALYDKGTRAGGIQKQRRGSGTRSVLQVLTGNRYSNGRDLSDEDAKLSQPCPGRTARSRTRRGGGG